MSIMVATGRGATSGVLFKDAEAIERMGTVDTLIVDKTGTLTAGKPVFQGVVAAEGRQEDEVLTSLRHWIRAPSTPRRRDRRRGAQARHSIGPVTDFESSTEAGCAGESMAA